MFRFPRLFLTKALLSAFLLASASGITSTANAQEWRNYDSQDSIYSLSFPEEFKTNETFLRLDDRYVIGANEITATADNRPYTPVVKHYILKFAQTLGSPLTIQQRQTLVEKEIDSYVKYYTPMKGNVLEILPQATQGNDPGGFVTISFEDPKLGPQVIKAHIVYTDQSMFQHIVTGSKQDIKAPSTSNFFGSLVPQDGLIRSNGIIKSEWLPYTPPMGIFTAYFPKPIKPFFPEDPQISSKSKVDRISARFYDPVWKQNVFVNIYGYVMDREIHEEEARLFLQERFVLKDKALTGSVVTSKLKNTAFPALDTTYAIKPPKDFGYMDTVRTRIIYGYNYIMAYEIRGSRNLVEGPFISSFLRQGKFTPADALARRKKNEQSTPGNANNAAPSPAPQQQPAQP